MSQKVSGEFARALDKHFLACAAAAAAVAAVGTSQQAEAGIVYSGLLDVPVNNTSAAGIYINFDGPATGTSSASVPGWDLNVFNSNSTTTAKKSILLYAPGLGAAVNNGVGTQNGNYGYISKLGAGVTVGPASNFAHPSATYPYTEFAYRSGSGSYDNSQWNGGVTDGFGGFKFTGADAQLHYGWVRLNVTSYDNGYQITVRDFAYETQPNTAIVTGATATVPEPTAACALGVLAMGAAGVRPRRKSA